MSTPQELVAQFEQYKGYRFSAAYIWGTAPFRPDDDVYALVRAQVHGDKLELIVTDGGAKPGPEQTIAITAPGKLKAGADSIRLTSATKVEFCGFFEATANGDKFRVSRDGKPGDEFPRKDEPALRLVAAPK